MAGVFVVAEGAPGNGKSLYMMLIFFRLLARNKKWFLKSGILRKVAISFPVADHVKKEWGDYFFSYSDPMDMVKFRHCDVIIDEIADIADARSYADLPRSMRLFFSKFRKRGIEIYANTQDFSMVDARARLMISRCVTLSKIIGSRDPSFTKPPVKNIWGIIWCRDVENFREINPEKKIYSLFGWSFFLISRDLTEAYDTTYEFDDNGERKLRHSIQVCENEGCDYKKIIHR